MRQNSKIHDAVYKDIVRFASEKKLKIANWRKENPALSKKMDSFLSGKFPELDFSKINQKW